MMEIVYGISLIYTGATPLGGYVKSYTDIANGKFLGISWLIWIAILVAVITWFIFNMTRHGKYMYAIGGNPQAAEVAWCSCKSNYDLNLHESSSYVWSCRFHAWRKSRWCIR